MCNINYKCRRALNFARCRMMINKYIKHTPKTTTNKIKKTKIPHFLLEHFQTLIVEICKIVIPNTHIPGRSLSSWLGTGTTIKGGWVKLMFNGHKPPILMKWCKCFPHGD